MPSTAQNEQGASDAGALHGAGSAPVRWSVGQVTVTRILELPPMAFDPAMFLQTDREEVLRHSAWLSPRFATEAGDIILHFQAFVIEAAGKRILVDPCIGNDKARAHPLLNMLDTAFLKRLRDAGFAPETIDTVVCTHLHVDHCGWNTMLVDGQWVPTFPNARYLFAPEELDHLQSDTSEPDAAAIYQDSVKPVLDAGLADLVEPGHAIVEGVTLIATPGHTPGHRSILISSEGHGAVLTGDVIHHPLQARLPELSSNFCWNPAMGTRTRRELLSRAADAGDLLIGAHFAGPTAVRLAPVEDGWIV